MPFEKLNGAFVFLSGGAALECAQVSSLAGLGVLLSRIQTVTAFNSFNHIFLPGHSSTGKVIPEVLANSPEQASVLGALHIRLCETSLESDHDGGIPAFVE
jgi:hypothetical protein